MRNGALKIQQNLLSAVLEKHEFIVELPQLFFKKSYLAFVSTYYLELCNLPCF